MGMHRVYDFRDDLGSVMDDDLPQLEAAVQAHAAGASEQWGVILRVLPDTFTASVDGGGTATWPLLGSLLDYRRGRRCRLVLAEPDVLGFGPPNRLRYVTLEHILEIWVETHGLSRPGESP